MKKILALCLVVVLAVTAVAGATLAYFTDAEQVTNEMTVGNVQINLEELKYDWKNSAWIDYDETKAMDLYPVSMANREAFNKSVWVYNTSSSQDEVYVRTIIAIPSALEGVIGLSFSRAEANIENTRYGCDWEKVGTATIDGYENSIYVCDTNGKAALKYGEYMMSLATVWMYDTVTNEMLSALIQEENDAQDGVTKGEDNLIDFDVKVLAQGVQKEGFKDYDEAMASFGNVLENVADWFEADDAVINDWWNKD